MVEVDDISDCSDAEVEDELIAASNDVDRVEYEKGWKAVTGKDIDKELMCMVRRETEYIAAKTSKKILELKHKSLDNITVFEIATLWWNIKENRLINIMQSCINDYMRAMGLREVTNKEMFLFYFWVNITLPTQICLTQHICICSNCF